MKQILFITLLCLSITTGLKAQTIKLFNEKMDQGYIIYAANNELYPISVSLDLDLTNLLFSKNQNEYCRHLK